MAFLNIERARSTKRVGWVSILGLILVPLAIGGLLLWALWNPTERLGQITAAVVNEDTPVQVGDQTVPLGRQLAAGLVAGDAAQNYTWVLTDSDDAADGLDSGRYATVVTIPSTFSAAATSYSGDAADAEQATIDVRTSDRSRLVDAAISQTITSTAAKLLNEQLTTTYLENIYVGFNTLHDQLGDAADGATQLADGANQLASGTDTLASGATSLADGIGQLSTGAGALSDGIGQLSTGAGALSDGIGQLSTGTATLADGLSQASAGTPALATGAAGIATGVAGVSDGITQLKPATDALGQLVPTLSGILTPLAEGTADLPSSTAALDDGAQQVADGASTLSSGLAEASTGSTALADGLTALVDSCAQSGASAEFCAGVSAAADGASTLSTGIDDAASGAAGLSTGASGVATGTSALRGAAPDITAGISGASQIASGLVPAAQGASTGISQLADSLPQLVDGSTQVADGTATLSGAIGQVATGAQTLASGAAQSADGAAQLADGTAQSADGAAQLADGASQSADGASQLAEGVPALADGAQGVADGTTTLASGLDTAVDQLPTYTDDERTKLADVVAQPVSTGEQSTDLFGESGLPLFAVIALWLGALASYLVMQAVSRSALSSTRTTVGLAFRSYLPGLLVGVVQGVAIAAVMEPVLKLDFGSWLAFAGLSVLAGAAFASINQGLVALFGGVGRFIAMVIAVVGLAAGIISTVPALFDSVLDWSPLSTALDGMQAVVNGTAGAGGAAVALVVWGLAGLVLSAVAVARKRSVRVAQLATLPAA